MNKDVLIFEQNLNNKEGVLVGKMAIIIGGVGEGNPKAIVDNAVKEYVGAATFSQFIDMHLDNPWVRVIIKGINAVDYEIFSGNHSL